MPPHSLRPVGAKVKINRSPILLPLQGVGVYALIPRAPAWAVNWLPFQGAPFRTLFVYHVRMLRHLLFGKKRTEIFLYFEHPTCKGKSKNQSFAHTFALTGRRCLCIDTQGASLGCELAALSGRSFSRFVRLSCAHASPPYYLAQKKAQWLQILALVHPFSRRGVARHAPVASRT